MSLRRILFLCVGVDTLRPSRKVENCKSISILSYNSYFWLVLSNIMRWFLRGADHAARGICFNIFDSSAKDVYSSYGTAAR